MRVAFIADPVGLGLANLPVASNRRVRLGTRTTATGDRTQRNQKPHLSHPADLTWMGFFTTTAYIETLGSGMGKQAKTKKKNKKNAPKGKDATPKPKDKAKVKAKAKAKGKGQQPNPEIDSGDERQPKLKNKVYEDALAELQVELVRLQKWIANEGLKLVLIFEGRDAAGKGGAIKRITQSLNPRISRVVALSKPTERESSQWYFQRYVPHLPGAGEMVLFDRSWYNRAGVERVMGFCTQEQHQEFLRSCPEFERMLVRSGILLVKYWFSVSDTEQERRFRKRITDPIRRWKISEMDLRSREHWVDYSRAKDEMLAHTDIKQAPWYVVRADDKKRARLNVISHLLSLIPYQNVPEPKLKLPKRQGNKGYVRPPLSDQTFVPEVY